MAASLLTTRSYARRRWTRPQHLVSVCLLAALFGCVTKTVVLTNDKGQIETCKKSGRVGIVSGYVLSQRLKSCIGKAEARGFKERQPATAAIK